MHWKMIFTTIGMHWKMIFTIGMHCIGNDFTIRMHWKMIFTIECIGK